MNLLMFRFSILVLVASVNAQAACKTPEGEPGICVRVIECSRILYILRNIPDPAPQKTLDYIKSNHCGVLKNVPYTCCSARHITTSNTAPKTEVDVIYKGNTDNNQEPMIKDEKDGEQDINAVVNNVDDHPNLKLLPLTQCGRIKNSIFSYGNASFIGELPWNVLLLYQTRDGLKFQCGGSLISSRYVLTAAHCFNYYKGVLVSVRVGEYNISSEIDCGQFGTEQKCADPAQDIETEKIISHPQYNHLRFLNDVALIRMKKEVDISSETVQAVCLPITEESQRQMLNRVIISGWGKIGDDASSDVLHKAIIPILPITQCQTELKRSGIPKAHICPGRENMIDDCIRDSGGPIIFPGKVIARRYVQYGIASVGHSCGNKANITAIYTKVSFYIKWILDQLEP